MQRFVINLDRSPERLAWMDAAFKRMELSYVRVPAIDGRTLSASDKALLCAAKSDGLPWVDGEVGVFLSHRKCWELIAGGDEDFGAVFEDDAHFSPNAADFLRDHAWIPPATEIVKLETYGQETAVDKHMTPARGHVLARLRAAHWGCNGYVVSKRAAVLLLEQTRILEEQVDVVLFDPGNRRCRIPVYQLVPGICVQDFVLRRGASGGFLASTMEIERESHRKSESSSRGWRKIRRELARPLFQFGHAIYVTSRNVWTDKRILRVPLAGGAIFTKP